MQEFEIHVHARELWKAHGQQAVADLRNKLRDAIDAADVKVAETKAKADRGTALLKQAEAELAALQASQHEFQERCAKDYSCAILAGIESGGDIPPMESDSGVLDNRPLVAAQMRLDAFKTVAAKLDADLAAARKEAFRSEKAFADLDATIFDMEVEYCDVLRSRW